MLSARSLLAPMRTVRLRPRPLIFLFLVLGVSYALFASGGLLSSSGLAYTWHLAILAYCGYYGFFRGSRFHPVRTRAYWEWLRRTPWRPGKALPLGPVEIVWQDALIVAVMVMLYALPSEWAKEISIRSANVFLPALVFLISYLVPSTFLVGGEGAEWANPLLLVLWPFMLLLPPRWGAMLVLSLLIYAIVYYGLRRSLHEICRIKNESHYQSERKIGWHYAMLSHRDLPNGISPGGALYISLLSGWWVYAVLVPIVAHWHHDAPQAQGIVVSIVYAIISVLIPTAWRLAAYVSENRSLWGFWSRIWGGRPIIPGYDIVFVSPLAGVVVGIIFTLMMWKGEGNLPLVAGLGVTSVLISVLLIGPSLRSWRLTGHNSLASALDPPRVPALEDTSTGKRQAQNKRLIFYSPVWIRSDYFTRRWAGQVLVFVVVICVLSITALIFGHGEAGPVFLIGIFVWPVMAARYAYVRTKMCHPIFDSDHVSWLRNSPWKPGKELPFGPPTLVWRDAFFLLLMIVAWASFCIAMAHSITAPLIFWPIAFMLIFFCLAYSFFSLFIFEKTRQIGFIFILCLAPGCLIVSIPHYYVIMALSLLVFCVSVWGIHRSLRGFPWPEAEYRRGQLPMDRMKWLPSEAVQLKQLGDHYFRLGPKVSIHMMSKKGRILLVGVISWWSFVILRIWELSAKPGGPSPLGPVVVLLICLGIIGAYIRFRVYTSEMRSPIGLWARIWTGKIIIPGYDKVFITPVASLLLVFFLGRVMGHIDLPVKFTAPVAIAMALSVLLFAGPSMKRWRLTGAHRVVIKPAEK